MKSIILTLAIFLSAFFSLSHAKQSFVEIEIDFDKKGSVIDAGYSDNSSEIAKLMNIVNLMRQNPKAKIEDIEISGYTSLENTHENNLRKSRDRAVALEGLIHSYLDLPEGSVRYDHEYIPWEWLKQRLAESSNPNRAKAIEIIERPCQMMEYFNGFTRDRRIFDLRWIDKIDFWTFLENNYFPLMHKAVARITFSYEEGVTEDQKAKIAAAPPVNFDTEKFEKQPTVSSSDSSVQIAQAPAVLPDDIVLEDVVIVSADAIRDIDDNNVVITPNTVIIKPNRVIIRSDNVERSELSAKPHRADGFIPRGSVKTNLAGWALSQVNLALEFDLGRHWSFVLPVYYSGWNYFQYELKFRTFDIKPELRYWPSRANKGLHIGVHAGVTWFNYAFKGEYRYANRNQNQPAVGGGLAIGYRVPISHNGRWSMEFGVSGGVYYVDYTKYYNYPNGEPVENLRKTYYGIDGVSISFVYSFNLRK